MKFLRKSVKTPRQYRPGPPECGFNTDKVYILMGPNQYRFTVIIKNGESVDDDRKSHKLLNAKTFKTEVTTLDLSAFADTEMVAAA